MMTWKQFKDKIEKEFKIKNNDQINFDLTTPMNIKEIGFTNEAIIYSQDSTYEGKLIYN